MVSGCFGFVRDFAPTFGPRWSLKAGFVRRVSRIFQVHPASTGPACRAILQVAKEGDHADKHHAQRSSGGQGCRARG